MNVGSFRSCGPDNGDATVWIDRTKATPGGQWSDLQPRIPVRDPYSEYGDGIFALVFSIQGLRTEHAIG